MFDPQNYLIASKLFTQLLGLIYFAAFGAFLFQIRGLMGREGILPVESFLQWIWQRAGTKAYRYVPTLFWLNASDEALMAVAALGTLFSILLFFYVYPVLMLILIYILYLSILSVGQAFLSFGWEMFLMEITVNAILMNMTATPNPAVWVSLNLLLFRFHFQGGIVKLFSRDVNWRNLTAVAYHYQTQPIPNMIAWYAHKLPLWFHKASTAIMFFVELVVPFAIFTPAFLFGEEVRLAVFFCFMYLQLMIWLTGNFSYLNHLTAVFSIILVSDRYLSPFLHPFFGALPQGQSPLVVEGIVTIAGILLVTMQLMTLWNHLYYPNAFFARLLGNVQPFHIVCRYGIFAVMTTKRYEVVVEGSDDDENWKEYGFYYKPSELDRRPRRISPYQPRLDWQIWFLPFSSYQDEEWFQNFMTHLLVGSKHVLALIRFNPFPERPPKYVRALIYDYKFTDWQTKKRTGQWWRRTLVGSYSPTFALRK
ncbi:MAG: lipase maturation factor family protein [Parachlamydia sp.]|nr:lipase maturation factor family protein [Parachlamydia sp.]